MAKASAKKRAEKLTDEELALKRKLAEVKKAREVAEQQVLIELVNKLQKQLGTDDLDQIELFIQSLTPSDLEKAVRPHNEATKVSDSDDSPQFGTEAAGLDYVN